MKKFLSFEFWQKFGKCLMVVIAVMPAAGLMVSIGNSIPLISPESELLIRIGNIIAQIGWGIIGNLHLLFALAIGGSWAKEKAGGAFSAGLAFILINLITGHFFGVTTDMLADAAATVTTVFGTEIPVSGYFVNILGQPALNMGVFVGIIAGFVGATAYNKYYNYRKLPDALTFFNGKRFVPFVVIYRSILVALCLAIERLLLPFGLHHMLTIPMNYTSLGGTYDILTGAQAGTQVFGQDPLWLAWVTDLINLKDAGDMTKYNDLLASITPARFKVGQMIGSSGILMGLTYAMYRNVDEDKKHKYKGMFISSALAVFLTGVTEPIEFMFMFAAMPLYLVYAFVQGAAFAMADVVNLRVHSFGNIEFLTRTPMAIKAGIGMDLVNFIWVSVLFAVLMYFIANFMIKKFNLATAGRNGNYDTETTDVVSNSNVDTANANSQVVQIINLLGGRDNIEDVDACMTRLRVSVKDVAQVGDENAWKQAGAMGLIIKDSGVQAVYGPKADVLKSDIQDLLESGVAIPRTEVVSTNTATSETKFKGITEAVYSVADGQAVSITEVNDPVFAQKMMGDGYAVEPVNGNVYAPVSGTVTSVFPTKHAVGILSDQGVEVLVHVGLDTVALNGAPFSTKVADGQHVQAGDLLLVADLDAIRSADRETTIVVAFTNSAEIKSVSLVNLGQVSKDSQVATVEL